MTTQNVTFRFPHAIGFYCQKWGFNNAVEKALEFAIVNDGASVLHLEGTAKQFVDNSMKARIAEFEAQQTHG